MSPHIHLIGIGGAGLSAIATVLLQQHYTISGSDIAESEAVQRLRALGATIQIGHAAQNLTRPDIVVISSAIPNQNPEVIKAQRLGIPVYKRPEWLGQMINHKRGLAIAGTNGKTTTTAMLSLILDQAGLAPSYIIGGYVPQLKTNAQAGDSDIFVIEADEYDHTFLSLKPEIALITNIEWDHPDTYPTENDLYQAYHAFIQRLPTQKNLILCGDQAAPNKIYANYPRAITYGIGEEHTWQAVQIQAKQAGYDFQIQYRGKLQTHKPVSLQVPGIHNLKNALGAMVVAQLVGVSIERAGEIISSFTGTDRRFQIKGEINQITIIDDYAHHPTSVQANLAAVRSRYPGKKIWVVFQPHTYSRTKILLEEFALSFREADHVILVDIYASREQNDGSISSADLLARMQANQTLSHIDAQYIGDMTQAVAYLQEHLKPQDVLITMGAGDVYKVSNAILGKIT